MADQDAEQLPQIRAYEKSSPAIIYFAISLLPLLVGISLVVGSLMTPAPFKVYLHWIAALAGGTGLAGLTLLGLTLVSVRGQRGWPIAFGLAILGWLGGLMATLNSSAPSPAKILAVMVPPSLAFLTYRIGIYIASGFLLPTDKKGGGRKQVHLFLSDYSYQVYPRLVRFFFYFFYRENRPCYVITDERREEDRIERRVKGNPFTKFATGPGIIISGCNYAVAVSDGLTFKGVKPPGVTFTGFGDQPVRTVDLRPQLRTFTVHALTKDGIEVQVLFFAPFEIDRGGLEPELGKPPPYRPGAAFKAVHQQKMEHSWEEGGNTQQRDWDELPVIVGKAHPQPAATEPMPLKIFVEPAPSGCRIRVQNNPAILLSEQNPQEALLVLARTVRQLLETAGPEAIELYYDDAVSWDAVVKIYDLLYALGTRNITFRIEE